MDSVFDVLGLIMVGPSSSHTAAMVKAGLFFKNLFSRKIEKVEVEFNGSLAMTGKGHGSHLAVVGGIMGFRPDDSRIKNSLSLAKREGISFRFTVGMRTSNVVYLRGVSEYEQHSLLVESIGGGHIRIREIDGFTCDFEPEYPLLISFHSDVPGIIAKITSILSSHNINIGWMIVTRNVRGGNAMATIKVDTRIFPDVLSLLLDIPKILRVIYMEEM
ncbi:MAG: L-serine ammonia-lyase, iron-sulfur-dependent subunit beta [Candidatus Korarchaeota archaeon]